MRSLPAWTAATFGLWYLAGRRRRCNTKATLAVATLIHVGMVAMIAGVTPVDIAYIGQRQMRKSFSRTTWTAVGSPTAILILLLRLSSPDLFKGKLVRWWPALVALLLSSPILFISRVSLSVYGYCIAEADLSDIFYDTPKYMLHLGLCLSLSVLIVGLWEDFRRPPPVPFRTMADTPIASAGPQSILPMPGRFSITPVTPQVQRLSASLQGVPIVNAPRRVPINNHAASGDRLQATRTLLPQSSEGNDTSRILRVDAATLHQKRKTIPTPSPGAFTPPYRRPRIDSGSNNRAVDPSPTTPGADSRPQVQTQDQEEEESFWTVTTPASQDDDDQSCRDEFSAEGFSPMASVSFQCSNSTPSTAVVEAEIEAQDELYQRMVLEELSALDAMLKIFENKVGVLFEDPTKRFERDVDQRYDLELDIQEQLLTPLLEMNLSRCGDLEMFRQTLVEETEKLLEHLRRLQQITSIRESSNELDEMPVDDTKSVEGPWTANADYNNDDFDPPAVRLQKIERSVKKLSDDAGQALAAAHSQERWIKVRERCHINILPAKEALQKLDRLEHDVKDKPQLDQKRRGLMESAVTALAICEFMTKNKGRILLPRPVEEIQHGLDKLSAAAVLIGNILGHMHQQCVPILGNPRYRESARIKPVVKWVGNRLTRASELVDKLSEVGDDALTELPEQVFECLPMAKAILLCLKDLEASHPTVSDALAHAKNVDVQLEILDRRRGIQEKRLTRRRVEFEAEIDQLS